VSFRKQQIAVFLGTVIVIFGLSAAGLWLVAQRLAREATLQTALLLARQVEIAMADSLRQRDTTPPSGGSFWDFLGKLFPATASAKPTGPSPRRQVKGLMQAYLIRSGGIEAMWVLNPEGRVLYASRRADEGRKIDEPGIQEALRRGLTTINPMREGKKVLRRRRAARDAERSARPRRAETLDQSGGLD
jgi:hypothetical protein